MPTLAETYCGMDFLLPERRKLKAFVTANCRRLYEWNLDGGLAGGTAYEWADRSACEFRREHDGTTVRLTRHPYASWEEYLKDAGGGAAQIRRLGGQHVEVREADIAKVIALLPEPK